MKSLALIRGVLQFSILSLLVSVSIVRGSAARHDWPEFRGPTGQGESMATNVPVHWSATSNVAWKLELPGEGWSSPVLVDGKVYLTTAVADAGTSLRVLQIDAKGKIGWNVEVFAPGAGEVQSLHKKNSLASPTLVVRGGKLYAHFGHMGTAALDLSGKILWRQTDLKYPPMHGNGGSPILVGDLLVFSCDGEKDPFLVALDINTGEVRWKTFRDSTATRKFSFSTPLAIEVSGSTQIISPTSGYVGAFDPADGREIWRVNYREGFSLIARPVFGHGLVFISSGYMRPVLHALDPLDAKGDVTATHVRWTHSKGAPNAPSPLVYGENLYFISDSGIATCVDARTGVVHWNERIGGDFSASPTLAEGRLYFQNETGVGTVVKAEKVFEVLARNDLGERTLASPAVADDALYLRSQKHLWRIGH